MFRITFKTDLFHLLWISSFAFMTILPMCSKKSPTENTPAKPARTNYILADTLASMETIVLYQNLQNNKAGGVMFGHQEDMAYGYTWWAAPGRSDVKEACGSYPAVHGWELGDIQFDRNINSVDFEQMKTWIKEVHKRGGINLFRMTLSNPVTDWDHEDGISAVQFVLPGQAQHSRYLQLLDKIAIYLIDLKTDEDAAIPILLNLYAAPQHSRSWWSNRFTTPEQYQELWKMTVGYFKNTHQLHNIIYVFSDWNYSFDADAYFKFYPGDEFVDVLAMQEINLIHTNASRELNSTSLDALVLQADSRGKPAAVTNINLKYVVHTDWWTKALLPVLHFSQNTKRLAFVHIERNSYQRNAAQPFAYEPKAGDLLKFFLDHLTIFENDLPAMYR